MRLKKGSAEAKAYMAKIRRKRKGKAYKAVRKIRSSVRHMAKKRRSYRRYFKRTRGKRDKRVPLLPMVGLAYNLIRPCPSGRTILDDIKNADIGGVLYDGKELFTGMDNVGTFHFDWLLATYLPIVAGAIGSKIASATGVNRAMKKIPLVGKYIKL